MSTKHSARWIFTALALATGGAAGAQNVVTAPPDKGSAQVTLFSGGAALVTDRRMVSLPRGKSTLRWIGLSGSLQGDSVQVSVAPDPERVTLSGRRLAPSTSSADALLRGYVGRRVQWIPLGADGRDGAPGEATLLEVTDGGTPRLLRVGNSVLVQPAGRLVLPDVGEIPAGDSALEMDVDAAEAGERTLEVTYLAGGWAWEATYAITVAEDGASATLSRCARIAPTGGTLLPPARLRLVAGPPGESPAPEYVVPDPVTLARPSDGEAWGNVWVSLGKSMRLPVREVLVFSVPLGSAKEQTQTVMRAVRFDNTPEAGLGVPLPAGKVTIYRGSAQLPRLAGMAALPAISPAESIEVPIRPAEGLVGVTRIASTRKLNPVTNEYVYEAEIENARPEAATVLVSVTLSGDWKVDDHTHDFRKVAPDRVEFTVPAAPGETTKLSYTVEIRREEE